MTTRLFLNMRTMQFVTASGKRAPTEAELKERRLDRNALAQAKRLAAKHGITVERDDQDRGYYWVGHPDLDDTPYDPIAGAHFQRGGREVLDAVREVVKALPV